MHDTSFEVGSQLSCYSSCPSDWLEECSIFYQLRGSISLLLKTLLHQSAGADIFTPRAFFAVKSALSRVSGSQCWIILYDDSVYLLKWSTADSSQY